MDILENKDNYIWEEEKSDIKGKHHFRKLKLEHRNKWQDTTEKLTIKQARKKLGWIRQKRLRKLLYSIGYGRNVVNAIVKFEWGCKQRYHLKDVEYWKALKDEGIREKE